MIVGCTRVLLYSVLCVCFMCLCVCVCVCIEFVHKCTFILMCVCVCVCTIHTFIYSSLCADIHIYVYTHAYEYKTYRHLFHPSRQRRLIRTHKHTYTHKQQNLVQQSGSNVFIFAPIYFLTHPRPNSGSNLFLFCSYIFNTHKTSFNKAAAISVPTEAERMRKSQLKSPRKTGRDMSVKCCTRDV